MAKDPAFLFYSKDWIEGTAEMLPEEKGVYIDLLAHQHQSGSLPTDTKRLARIARLAHEEFLKIWEHGLNEKFYVSENRLLNKKMVEVTTDRSAKALKNKIVGTFAGVLKKLKISHTDSYEIRKQFVATEFIDIPTECLTIRITEWIEKRLPSLGNANANGDKDNKGGMGEIKQSAPGWQMMKEFKKSFPDYHEEPEKDLAASLKIIYKIAHDLNITKHDSLNGSFEKIKLRWGEIVPVLAGDNWYRIKNLSFIANDWQQVIQLFNNGSHKQTNGTPSGSAKQGTSEARINTAKNW